MMNLREFSDMKADMKELDLIMRGNAIKGTTKDSGRDSKLKSPVKDPVASPKFPRIVSPNFIELNVND